VKYFNSLFTGVKWTTISSIVVSVSAVLRMAILARYLEREDFGHFALVLSVLSFVQLFSDFGLAVSVLHKQDISRAAYSSLYWLSLLSSILLYLIFLGLIPWIARYFEAPVLNQLLPIAGIGIILSAAGNLFRILTWKELRYQYIAVSSIAANVAGLICAVYMAITGWGIWSLIVSTLLISLVMQLYWLAAGLRRHPLQFTFSFREIRPFWKIGKFAVGGEMVNYFTREIDILMIGKLSDAATLGAYSLARQLVQKPGQLISRVITDASLPILPKLQDDIDRLREGFLKISQSIATLMALVYGSFILLAGLAVPIIYGPEYAFLTDICRIFALFFYWRMVLRFNANLIIATGKTKLSLLMNVITFPLTVAAIAIGYHWGLEGIVWGQVVMMLVLLLLGWQLILHPLLQVSWFTYFKHTLPSIQLIREVVGRVLNMYRSNEK
jgi:PST family polysaccharide transporter/teichuronic acid exporter